jgi:hypothetical protein
MVFAGDHGLTEEGRVALSGERHGSDGRDRSWPGGRASTRSRPRPAWKSASSMRGVAADLPAHPDLIAAKIRAGTRNATREPALTRMEVDTALARGAELAASAIMAGADAIAIGEMGIGNTASAALIMHRLAPAALDECVGAGAGQDEAGMVRKRAALARAASRSAATHPHEVLSEFGGCEIVMMAGAVLGAARATQADTGRRLYRERRRARRRSGSKPRRATIACSRTSRPSAATRACSKAVDAQPLARARHAARRGHRRGARRAAPARLPRGCSADVADLSEVVPA